MRKKLNFDIFADTGLWSIDPPVSTEAGIGLGIADTDPPIHIDTVVSKWIEQSYSPLSFPVDDEGDTQNRNKTRGHIAMAEEARANLLELIKEQGDVVRNLKAAKAESSKVLVLLTVLSLFGR